MISTDELAAIERRAESATPGPWECVGNTVYVDRERWWALLGDSPTAAFIAAARSDVPALCAEVRRVKIAHSDIAVLLRQEQDRMLAAQHRIGTLEDCMKMLAEGHPAEKVVELWECLR